MSCPDRKKTRAFTLPARRARMIFGLALAGMALAAHAEKAVYPQFPTASYSLGQVDQFNPSLRADVLPRDGAARSAYARAIAMDATIYGLASVLQYREMFLQAVDPSSDRHVGFDRFIHDRDLAGPDYRPFKSPNSDTLYSNAWLDLSDGPVLIETPDIPLKYYTLNFLDMYANATNISTRTFGSKAGRYLIAPANWRGPVPDKVTLFRVATPYMWVLFRVFAQRPDEVMTARAIQDSIKITRLQPRSTKAGFPAPETDNAAGFFRVLDHVLRTNGHPDQEDALVYRFRSIGIGGTEKFDAARLDPEIRAGIDAGFADAMNIIKSSRSQLGTPTDTNWNRTEKARYGFNYLNRAVINHVGLGANVEEENLSFNTFADGTGKALDGSKQDYTLTIKPPPVHAFWSVTLYEGSTFALYPNEMKRYLINAQTPGLQFEPDGTVRMRIQHARPATAENWLPAPNAPFYIAIRSYLPKPEMISGGWRPEAIIPVPKTTLPSGAVR
jgi:hypothetical protein